MTVAPRLGSLPKARIHDGPPRRFSSWAPAAPSAPAPTAQTDARPYLSVEQLADLTPRSPDAIDKMVRRRVLKRGVHYFQPLGRRTKLIFKWAAIAALIEGRPVPGETVTVVDRTNAGGGTSRAPARVIDVEKAETDLQRLLA